MKSHDTGLRGEDRAEDYLLKMGMKVLARRYRAQDGEIDLVMEDGTAIVFVEVKARPKGMRGDGLRAVTYAKQRRMTHAAQAYLVEHGLLERPVRFDALEITAGGILHVPNAFMAVW